MEEWMCLAPSGVLMIYLTFIYCMESVQIRSFFWSVFSCVRNEYGDLLPKSGKYGPEKTPYLDDTFHAVINFVELTQFTPQYLRIKIKP